MAQSYFFYDLETSGLNPRTDRIMQFAGQRTDASFNPIGEPVNIMVRLNDDTLPSPEAVMVTGITPQSTQADGLSEAEFARMLCQDIFTADTVTVGYNNVRFDDEFIRHLFWRTFHDPYEWCWKQGCSRWDLLDVVRMTRALRPEGIEWPIDAEGKATNRLELITKLNGIEHGKAHDALSDVEALIGVAQLLRAKQPKLFDYLRYMRDKKSVQTLISLETKPPFVYVSGRYDVQYNKATVAVALTEAPNGSVVVYDLRHDPTPFLELGADELKRRLFASWQERQADGYVAVPVKRLQFNHCPAVAPLGVLEQNDGWQKLSLNLDTIERHRKTLQQHPAFAQTIRTIIADRPEFARHSDAEAQLYDGFVAEGDKAKLEAVRNADERTLAGFEPGFSDKRLEALLLRYKARNYPKSLSEDEALSWESWRSERLQAQLPGFVSSLQRLAGEIDDSKRFLLEELQLWAEAIMPVPDEF